MTRQPSFAPEVLALFAARGAGLTDVGVIQPADPFLDIAGEDLRRRIFLTESETGEQLCLRPEFTIPVCLDHIAARAATPRRYAYLGEVFRQRRDGAPEFFQAGIEDLGDKLTARADARSIADAHALLTAVLPGETLAVTIGDQTIFEAVLAALGLPRGWRMRLARAFGDDTLLDAALADLTNGKRSSSLPPAIARLVRAGDQPALARFIEAGMAEAGMSPSLGRSPADIARRLAEKAELQSVHLTAKTLAALKSFLAINVSLEDAASTLSKFARSARLDIGLALEGFSTRIDAIAASGLDTHSILYDAAFGRPLDYYTGLVFEIGAPGADRPLAGGGRYDRLLTLLGAKKAIPGVGFSIWLDRVAALRGTA